MHCLRPIIKSDFVGCGDLDAADDKKSNHARTCPQAPLQRSCHEVTEGLLAYAQLTGYAKMTAVINTPKNRESRNYPFSLHEVLYIQRRRVLGYVALLKAVIFVKIEHASAVVSAHGGEMTVFEYERRAVLGSDA